jgi:manganese transport protein
VDLAEVIGSAIALNLLFGIPLPVGCHYRGDVLLLLMLQARFRTLKHLCFSRNNHSLFRLNHFQTGIIPITSRFSSTEIITNPNALYSIGILGATVMPHLPSFRVVQTRNYEETEKSFKICNNRFYCCP